MSGYGYGSGQMVLQWIIFGLLILWSLTQLVTFNTLAAIIDLTAIFIVAVLAIIVWAMAFRPAVLSNGA
jgi:hypothetical protein